MSDGPEDDDVDGVMSDGPEDDDVDGCELEFAEEPVDDETAELLPLFPGSEPSDVWDGVEFVEVDDDA